MIVIRLFGFAQPCNYVFQVRRYRLKLFVHKNHQAGCSLFDIIFFRAHPHWRSIPISVLDMALIVIIFRFLLSFLEFL